MAKKRDDFNAPDAGSTRGAGVYGGKQESKKLTDTPPPEPIITQPSTLVPTTQPVAPVLGDQNNRFRQEQLRMIQQLEMAAMGDPNSRAQQQMRDIYGQQRSQISSGISGARGVAAGAAQEMIQRNRAAADQAYNLDSRALMSQEQLRAQLALLTELGYLGDQDINAASSQMDSEIKRRALTDDWLKFGVTRGYEKTQADADLQIAKLRALAGLDTTTQTYNAQDARRIAEAAGSAIEAYRRANAPSNQSTAQQGTKLTDLEKDK